MNEATFEARINAEIAKHFPKINRLDITHQRVFTIKYGHSELKIGNNKGVNKFGRLDLLISYKNIPLAVLELKKPGIELTDSDRDQGISYARLLDRIAPLVILSNGSDVKIYNTIEKCELEYEDINERAINELFEHVSKCASRNEDEAICLLLGQDHNVWSSLLNDFTKNQFERIKGSSNDFRWPIVDNFNIKRTITDDIIKLLNQNRQKIILKGDSLSGKTNVIYQVCNNEAIADCFVPIYINCLSVSSGVFETIANYLSRKFYYEISTMDIKRWMNFGISNSHSPKILITIDSISFIENDYIKKDIEELVEISKVNNNIFVLISFDQGLYEKFVNVSGRSYANPIFRDFEQVKLNKLSDNEFSSALKYLKSEHYIDFHHGVNYNVDFRDIRILRMLFARLDRAKVDVSNSEHYKNQKIIYTYPSITTGELLEDVWKYIEDNFQLKIDLINYAEAYIKDKNEHHKNPSLRIFSLRNGSITHKTLQKELHESTINRLLSQGIIKLINGPNNLILYQPIIPELLSAAVSYYIGEKCYSIYNDEGVEKAVNFLIEESEPLPYGEVVGEHALYLILKKDSYMFAEFINELLDRVPYMLSGNVTGKYAVKGKDNCIKICKEENKPIKIIRNLHPYLILSTFACNNFTLKKGELHPLIPLIYKIGSVSIILRSYRSEEANDMLGLHYHQIRNNEWVICNKVGIIEPITFAMVLGLWREPEVILKIAEMMEEDNNYHLAARLHLAATYFIENIMFEKSSKAAKKIIDLSIKVLSSNLDCDTINQILKCKIL